MTIDDLRFDNDLPNINSATLQTLEGSQQPVLVVGMHNSGTSILTEILHKSGIFFGANMKHHESYFFTNFINDRIILGGGDNWAKLPLMNVEKILSLEFSIGPFINNHWYADYLQWGYDGVSPWGIKDPRLCILLPLYLKIFPQAKVVHIRRNPDDVAASLTGKFKAGVGILDDFEHWKSLTIAYTQRVMDFSKECQAYYELNYEDFCLETIEQTQALFSFLDLSMTENIYSVMEKVTPSRIGSYQRMVEAQKHPLRSQIKTRIGKLFQK